MATGRPPGNYNPKGPHGWFGKGKQYSDDIDAMQQQIQAQKSVSEALNKESDQRDKDIQETVFGRRARKEAQAAYDIMIEKFKADKRVLEGLNLNDPNKVVDYSIRLLHHYGVTDTDPACYRVAGTVGAMFDSQKIPYTCYMGVCMPNGIPSSKVSYSNHVWVVSGGKIYEHFPGYSNSQLGLHEPIAIIGLKKR